MPGTPPPVVGIPAFVSVGGGDGDLQGSFVGDSHQGVVGTLQREDLLAGFGAE